MSEKLYTAAEVAALIAEERAKVAGGNKPVSFSLKSGVSKSTGKPFSGVQMSGPFFPVYLSMGAAHAIVENVEALKAALNPVDPNAPRIAKK